MVTSGCFLCTFRISEYISYTSHIRDSSVKPSLKERENHRFSSLHGIPGSIHKAVEGKQPRRRARRRARTIKKKMSTSCAARGKWQISWLVSPDSPLPVRFMAPSLSPGRHCFFLQGVASLMTQPYTASFFSFLLRPRRSQYLSTFHRRNVLPRRIVHTKRGLAGSLRPYAACKRLAPHVPEESAVSRYIYKTTDLYSEESRDQTLSCRRKIIARLISHYGRSAMTSTPKYFRILLERRTTYVA